MAIIIELRTRILDSGVYSDWSDWSIAVDTSSLVDTDLLEYRSKPVHDVDYVTEYVTIYEQLVETSMESQISGKDSILEKQFALLEANTSVLSIKEIVAAKNSAYSNLRSQIMVNSQKTAMALLDKKYKFNGELEQQDKQLELMNQQVLKAMADVDYVDAQRTSMLEQVIDNRRIKALDSLADTYGTAMAGGLKLTTEMWTTYFEIVIALSSTEDAVISDPGTSTVVVVA